MAPVVRVYVRDILSDECTTVRAVRLVELLIRDDARGIERSSWSTGASPASLYTRAATGSIGWQALQCLRPDSNRQLVTIWPLLYLVALFGLSGPHPTRRWLWMVLVQCLGI